MHFTIALVGAALLSLVAANDESYRTLNTANNPDWMGGLDDSRGLQSLSIPGTHDSMAIMGGGLTQCQENYGASGDSLVVQAQAGIRMFDIRLRIVDGNKFAVHHGAVYQQANFDDVINKLGGFLDAHPKEAVILRVKHECTGDIGSCDDVPNQADFATIFDTYAVSDRFWKPSVSRGSAAPVPTLGEVRGKIVVAVVNGAAGERVESYGFEQFAGWHDGSSDFVQDAYGVKNTGSIATKRDQVRRFLDITGNTGDMSKMYVNFCSGSSLLVHPDQVARGSGGTTGVNPFLYGYLAQDHGNVRTGVMMMDFPGGGLINRILEYNLFTV